MLIMELILIRHGETDWNRRQCFQGQIDVPLNANGLVQAERMAQRLALERVDAMVCSDLMRTRQTAAPAAAALGLAPSYSEGWREQAFGLLEGLTFDDIRQRHPEEFALWARHDPDYELPGGAESRRRFHARVNEALQALSAAHAGRTLAVITHGGVLDMVYRSALGLSLHGPRECAIPNAGLNRVRVSEAGLEIVSWADDAHVADLLMAH
ncbi:histidine phosphatase family protein [Roseateles toxinivorans]|uniref:Putative phosphoglycerate mutase n=1 Tax=Roseateles toxinivorans TaxID=270368 RepID=A0A4R6QGI9_9BURK|nr:putative phosphoglycerate mutase [Roseateles toxinivorans]